MPSYTVRYDTVFTGAGSEALEHVIAIATTEVATEIGIEADGASPAQNAARRQFATAVLRNPAKWQPQFRLIVAATADDPYTTDAAIKTAIENAWNVLSGAPDAT